MYEIRCIFCKSIHRSEFFDEIEDGILRCRDMAADWQKGLLSTFPDDTVTITVEASMENAQAAYRAQRAREETAAFV